MTATNAFKVEWLQPPTEPEIKRMNEVLQEAFSADNSFTDFLCDGDRSLMPIRYDSIIRSASVGGRIQVARSGPQVEDIAGVAIWFGPGQDMNLAEEQRVAGGTRFLDTAPEVVRDWNQNYYAPVLQKLADDSLGPGFKFNQWKLVLFGVLPEFHGKGIAKALMSSAEEQAVKDGASIVLDTVTSTNVAIYHRLGFELKGEVSVTSRFGTRQVYQMLKTL